MNLGPRHIWQRGAHRAIEPLHVARLHDRARPFCDRQNLIGFVERRGDRLLDEHVLAKLQRLLRDAKCAGVGTTIVTASHRREATRRRRYALHAELRRDLRRALGSAHRQTRRSCDVLHVAQDSNVMEAETAGADRRRFESELSNHDSALARLDELHELLQLRETARALSRHAALPATGSGPSGRTVGTRASARSTTSLGNPLR